MTAQDIAARLGSNKTLERIQKAKALAQRSGIPWSAVVPYLEVPDEDAR